MKLKIDFIDAFTDTVFKGNSAGVVVLKNDNGQNQKQNNASGWLDTDLMQSIATQNNLSETAFLVRQTNSDKSADTPLYHIRWFSPLIEIDFCGHATLASAFVIFDKDKDLCEVQFHADAVGILTVTKRDDGKIQMDFPNQKPKRITDLPKALVDGLSIKPVEVYQNRQAYFVIYDNEKDVLTVERNNELLATLAPFDVVVTCLPESEPYKKYDFMSRYFWPASGGGEDPVTGSAHVGLAPLWADKLGKDTLLAYQASRRGGELECTLRHTEQGDRVLIAGNAVRYLSGVIEV